MTVYNVVEFGADRTGKKLNTAVLSHLIEKCQVEGGGELYFPAGKYLTGTVELKDNLVLNISAGASLIFSDNPADHKIIKHRWEGEDCLVYSPLIYGKNIKNVTICGRGIIDGQGKRWWDNFLDNKLEYPRPRTISFVDAEDILIEGIKIINSPAWTINPLKSKNITIEKVSIRNPADSPNTDGINPSSCQNVHIANCHIDVGDDCITIKSGTEKSQELIASKNITITNCTMVHGHGGVVIGSEMSGSVRNVAISNCIFNNTDRGIRLKSRRGRGGVVENIVAANLVMSEVYVPIVMNLYYFCGAGGKSDFVQAEADQQLTEFTPVFKDIYFNNIRASKVKSRAIFLQGLPESPLQDIWFDNVSITMSKAAKPFKAAMMSNLMPEKLKGVYCNNYQNIIFDNVQIKGVAGAKFEVSNGKKAKFLGITAQ
ncbi:glycoside hydrolase family 28 protein [Halanaerobium salsuginis]|jgi:polygalacturonase|uniref:Polygalacturonase n=1 Tax=Halanaerobium salsuginis TaxID=29563 RepID=A0A1I4HWC0_9FIRM|nr:glycoside hydrolase family 28 protein [Halanaerobium salsuginis]SFL46150.1 Polygalacturonase [Halanaerobium salsuginis]